MVVNLSIHFSNQLTLCQSLLFYKLHSKIRIHLTSCFFYHKKDT